MIRKVAGLVFQICVFMCVMWPQVPLKLHTGSYDYKKVSFQNHT
jgi:hypothetical protein